MKKKLILLVVSVACIILLLTPITMTETPMSVRIDNPNPLTGGSTLIWTVSPTNFGTRYVLPGHSTDLVVTISNSPSSTATWDWDYIIFTWSGQGSFTIVDLSLLPPEIAPGNSWTGKIGTFTVWSTTPLGTIITGTLKIHCSISGALPTYYDIPIIIIVGGYALTIYSSPTGVTFTVDTVSHTTPWSGTYSYGASVSLVMPEFHTVGEARYYWDHWGDGVTTRSRTVTMTANVTLTAYFTGPYYQLTVTSSPITGVSFTIDGTPQTTPYTEWLLSGSYALVMPEIHTVGEARYYWDHWGDGVTTRSRTVTLTTTVTLTAYFTGPYYQLTVTSSPITGVSFTIDGTPQTTPYTEWLLTGSYTLEMPARHNGYVWSKWLEDGDTNRIKMVNVNTTITLTGTFVVAVGGQAIPINEQTIKPESSIPWMWLSAIIFPLVATVVFVKLKKKK